MLNKEQTEIIEDHLKLMFQKEGYDYILVLEKSEQKSIQVFSNLDNKGIKGIFQDCIELINAERNKIQIKTLD